LILTKSFQGLVSTGPVISLLPPRHSGRFPAAGFAFGGRGSLHAAPGLVKMPVPSVQGIKNQEQRTCEAKAYIAVAVAGREVAAIRRPAEQRIEVPAAAANHAVRTGFCPWPLNN